MEKNNQKWMLNLPASKLPAVKEPEDFRSSPHWRIWRVAAEFVDGWQFLADFKNTVTFFGSARFNENDRWYSEARKLSQLLAKNGFGVVTGGGPGIMEAGNRGAVEGGGSSVGLNIKLHQEQRVNPYVKRSIAFHYFFVRKTMLSFSAQAYVFFPGGFGTLDEMFEILTLVQTKKIRRIPVILVGKDFWGQLDKWMSDIMFKKYQAIDRKDFDLFTIVDTVEEAFKIIKNAPKRGEVKIR